MLSFMLNSFAVPAKSFVRILCVLCRPIVFSTITLLRLLDLFDPFCLAVSFLPFFFFVGWIVFVPGSFFPMPTNPRSEWQ